MAESNHLDQLANRMAARAEAIEALRTRAGLSMDDLAQAMGYRGQSSIQRYLRPDYLLSFRPELIEKFRRALLGKGNPPINERDLAPVLGLPADQPGVQTKAGSLLYASSKPDSLRFSLTLPEGDAVVEIPVGLSPASAELLKTWLLHTADAMKAHSETQRKKR